MTKVIFLIVLLIIGSIAIPAYLQFSKRNEEAKAWLKRQDEANELANKGYRRVLIPSDPDAEYNEMSVEPMDKGLVAIYRRNSSSGLTYSKKYFDCLGNYKYISEGESMENMHLSPNSALSRIIDKSIPEYESNHACATHPIKRL